MRRTPVLILLGAAALAAAVFLPRVFKKQQEGPAKTANSAAPAAAGGSRNAPVRVIVHRVTPRTLSEKITANGSLLANESVELRSEIAGKIVEVAFEEGGRVQQGDLLLRINDSELQAQLKQTLIRTEFAKTRVGRQKQLLEGGSTAQDAYDSAANDMGVLEAEADLIRARLDKTRIRAPFSGIIGLRMVSEGSYITPATPIATLQDVDRLKIDFSVSERHMQRLHPGSSIRFSVAGGNEKFRGEIYAIEPAVDLATRTILLRARSENFEGRLLPGAFASVEVTLDEIKDAILVPTQAIIPGLNERSLFVMENGKAALRAVETGIRLDREIQITAGLAPDAIVITSGLLQIRNGSPVEPLDSE